MKLAHKLMLAFLGIMAMTMLSAYQDNCQPQPVCPPEPPCCDIPAGPTTSAYNHPANIDVCGSWDFYVTGTFLWWQPIEEQLEYAITTFTQPSTNVQQIHNLGFDWKPAFKVGLGYAWGYDNWDTYLQYTRVNTSMSNTTMLSSILGATLVDIWLAQPITTPFTSVADVQNKWDLDFNIFDLEFGRPYYNGKHLTFKTHYGLRGGWIDQSNKVTTTGIRLGSETTMEGTFKSDSWLIGPRTGIYTKWELNEGFRFFGNAAVALFYQKFNKISLREPYVNDTTQWFLAKDYSLGLINPSVDMLLGLGWGTYFDRNNWHFDLSLGYEAQVYFNQNKMRSLVEMGATTSSTVLTKPGNLMFHGLNVTARLEF